MGGQNSPALDHGVELRAEIIDMMYSHQARVQTEGYNDMKHIAVRPALPWVNSIMASGLNMLKTCLMAGYENQFRLQFVLASFELNKTEDLFQG